jgi:hypothetical protein
MASLSLACPACGGRDARRRDGQYCCAFCGAVVAPQLLAGALCSDSRGTSHCGQPAQTLCRACARPLCDRHNDPKAVYWHEPLHWRRLCSAWTQQDGTEWDRLNEPGPRLPVEGFEPFPWVSHDRDSQYQIGLIEAEILAAVRDTVSPFGGDVDDTAARFESLCGRCEAEVAAGISARLAAFEESYREVAYAARARSLRTEAEQGLRYVLAFLRRPIARTAANPPGSSLHLDTPRREWDAFGAELSLRIETLERLIAALAGA